MARTKKCPKCSETGHDSKGDHLFLMSGGNRWCCNRTEYHSDGEVYYEDEGDAGEDESYTTKKDLFTLINELNGGEEPSVPASSPSGLGKPVGETLRGVLPSTFEKFKVRGEYTEGKLTAIFHELLEVKTNKVLTKKYRKLPKDFFCAGKIGKGTKIQLFGQSVFPRAKRLLITEGELDAMSAWQMLGKWRVACVSLPLGANCKALLDNLEYLKGFKEIYICTDQDDAGEAVARDIANLLPQARFMKISEKDANDMLTKGKEAEFVSAFWDAEIYKPDTVVKVSDVITKVMEKPKHGVPWPWPSLTKATYGRNEGQGMYVGAGVKIGKSEFINEVIRFDVENKRKIAVLKYEEPPFLTVKRVAGKIDGIMYHKPGVVYSDAQLRATAESMQDYLLMYPAFGQAKWESTRDFIRYAALSGYKTIIIDPITRLTNGMDASQTEKELRGLSDELACMAQDLGFFYIVTCHLKAPNNGPPHERGGKVQSSQFRGSRAMMESTFYMLGIERNKDPDLTEEERNTSHFVLLEDRNFGNTCKFPVHYNKVDQSYLEKVGGLF